VRLGVEQGGARLEVEVDPGEVPHFGLWLNRGGWTPFRAGERPGAAPYHNLAFEPCLGAPDALDAALGAWRGAQWLAPGATRRWTLTWRGRATPAGA
jgi:galactose mutarotase-like enzyme